MPDARRPVVRAVLGLVLVLPAGAYAVDAAGQRADELAALEQQVQQIPRDAGGQFAPPNFRGEVAGFPAFVRDLVPPRASYRLQQGPLAAALRTRPQTPFLETSACGRVRLGPLTGPDYRWLTYQLLPRLSTCDLGARWSVWLGLEPIGLPADAVLHRYAPDLVVAELPTGGPDVEP